MKQTQKREISPLDLANWTLVFSETISPKVRALFEKKNGRPLMGWGKRWMKKLIIWRKRNVQ